jgi:hypothetical protein
MTRKYFGGIYTSTRTLNAGDRVRLVRKLRNGDPTSGRILNVTRGDFGERVATVRWDCGVVSSYDQMCETRDLRRA